MGAARTSYARETDNMREVIFIFDMLNLNPKADNKCQTLNAYNGTGGNNMPLVLIGESNEQS